MSPRYAAYYAPAQDSPLSQRAAAWLGRDAWTGEAVVRPAFPELADLDLDELTADARGYGFHATLKAPFELRDGQDETALLDGARALAAGIEAFSAPIAPAWLGRFLAFRPTGDTAAIDRMHAACVIDLEPFRAPISEFDLARRRKARLTPEQDQRLRQWGYPSVFEDFRFHMTLTTAIRSDEVRDRVAAALAAYFAEDTGEHRFEALSIFRQPARGQPFTVLGCFPFSNGSPAHATATDALAES